MTGFSLTSWTDVAILVGIASTLAAIAGGMIKSRLDRESSEAAASDRIIRLIEQEAEKRVQVVRTEFQLKIAQMELAHKQEFDEMKAAFEREIQELRNRGLDCSVPDCPNRSAKPIKIRPTR